MPRVAIIIPSCSGGGVTKVMLSLYQALAAEGAEVELLVLEKRGDFVLPDGLRLHYLYDSRQRRLDSRGRMARSVRDLQALMAERVAAAGPFDLILSNTSRCDRLVAACDWPNSHYVVHASLEETLRREWRLGPIKYYRKWRWVKCLDGKRLITVSDGIGEEIRRKGRIHPAAMQTIYNPFDLAHIQALAREPQPALPAEPYLIHIGRFARQKRHDVLFAALKLMPEAPRLVLLSNHPDKVRAAAEAAGVAERVLVPPFQQNPYPWIAAAKALVLSSDFEGLPTVLIEALACGTPVVSTDCPTGPVEILTGPLARFLVPRRDPAALAATTRAALAEYPPVAEAEILDKVSARTIARRYLALCQPG
ncbi:glycosyltransferase [Pseudaeromonas sp. ZJS20]|uniref:glycosyltransferase n=1 Tax=Pseudaeromonas aegiceratis TaxID=3153928 RepID=UPI00390C98A0